MQKNNFDDAERWAQEALQLDASNSSASALSGNIVMLRGAGPGGGGDGKDDAK